MRYFYLQLARFWEAVFMGVGAHLTVSVAGIFFFGFPVSVSVAGYTLGILEKHGVSPWGAAGFAVVAAVLSGFFFVYLYLRLSGESFAILSLASVLAFDAVVRSWDSVTGGVLGIAGIARPLALPGLFEIAIFGGILALGTLLFEYAVLQSPLGRSFRGLKESDTFLASFGISPRRTGATVILIAALVGGLAGITALWRIQFIDPNFGGGGVLLLIQGLTVAIIASKPQLHWLLAGLLFTTFLPEILRLFALPSSILGHVRMLLYGALLIVLVNWVSYNQPEKRVV
jgi:branched-chain amino acid transport system permease protein